MRVLYVVGSCLTKNTSANMSHNGYVQGFLENGCKVDIIMASDSWGQEDAGLPTWLGATYFSFSADSFKDRLRKWGRGIIPCEQLNTAGTSVQQNTPTDGGRPTPTVRRIARKLFYAAMPTDPLYPLEHAWLKRAARFESNVRYDLVISNSSPAASHKLVDVLTKRERISYDRWIQIWEDPWYFDLYGGHSELVQEEEHSLLRAGQLIYYVSPLTLKYQQQYYPDCASKMSCLPLPYLKFSQDSTSAESNLSFGYLGDYYSHVRNLIPFYNALQQIDAKGFIYGDSDINLECTDSITVSGRVTLDKLAEIQDQSSVLVHLCNLRGGQIPGKIYHYSATRKPILFVLDGTPEEKAEIRGFFEPFNRYYFCENSVSSILAAIDSIRMDMSCGKNWAPVEAFSPKEVVKKILE